MKQELINQVEYLENKPVETIYFGGGTPSLLTKTELLELLNTIRLNYHVTDHPEITLEANPDDINRSSLKDWKLAGINRLSVGLQSFKREDLEWMNRAHTVDEALNCIQLAKDFNFENLTVDLIYGLPNLTMEEWEQHIRTVISMDVPHISAYCLTIEEKTALHSLVQKGKISPASENSQSDQFLLLVKVLQENGYQQYEISNFSKPGNQSKHNSNYWKGEWYLGIGPSAHSFNGVSRKWNIANNQKYMKAINENKIAFEIEILTPENQFNERILTGIRTIYGVNISELSSIIDLPHDFLSSIDSFTKSGYMKTEQKTIFLTQTGRLQADYIASELFV